MFFFSSCGTFRKVFKLKQLEKVEITKEVKTDSIGLKIDKSVITIKESVDTTVVIPAKVVEQDTFLNMDSLVNGLTAVKNELVDVRFILNPKTGILSTTVNLKPQRVPVKFDKETKIENDIKEKSDVSKSGKDKLSVENKSNVVDKEPAKVGGLVAIVAIVIVVIVAGLLISKFFKPKNPIT